MRCRPGVPNIYDIIRPRKERRLPGCWDFLFDYRATNSFLRAMQLSGSRHAIADEVLNDLDRRFRKPLIIYFRRRLVGRSEDAEDLTQEVFMRLARRPDRNNGETIEAYVFTIASNILSNWHR